MHREVTELDFRMPEYRNAKTEDYEFRSDGKLVRKDRWENGIHSIRDALDMHEREFEIADVVEAARVAHIAQVELEALKEFLASTTILAEFLKGRENRPE